MKSIFFPAILFSLLLFAVPVFAGGDEIELKDGTTLKGDIVLQSASQYYIDTHDPEKGLMRVDISSIKEIHFGPKKPDSPATQKENS